MLFFLPSGWWVSITKEESAMTELRQMRQSRNRDIEEIESRDYGGRDMVEEWNEIQNNIDRFTRCYGEKVDDKNKDSDSEKDNSEPNESCIDTSIV